MGPSNLYSFLHLIRKWIWVQVHNIELLDYWVRFEVRSTMDLTIPKQFFFTLAKGAVTQERERHTHMGRQPTQMGKKPTQVDIKPTQQGREPSCDGESD